MTIQERREREEYDRKNPWRPLSEAEPGGTVCELLFSSTGGDFMDGGDHRYFLDEDCNWYQIEPPKKILSGAIRWQSVMNWRPTMKPARAKLSPSRRAEIKRIASRRDW